MFPNKRDQHLVALSFRENWSYVQPCHTLWCGRGPKVQSRAECRQWLRVSLHSLHRRGRWNEYARQRPAKSDKQPFLCRRQQTLASDTRYISASGDDSDIQSLPNLLHLLILPTFRFFLTTFPTLLQSHSSPSRSHNNAAFTPFSSGQFCSHPKDSLAYVLHRAHSLGFTHFHLSEHIPRANTSELYLEELEASITPATLRSTFSAYVVEAPRLQAEYAGSSLQVLVRVTRGFPVRVSDVTLPYLCITAERLERALASLERCT